MTSLAGFVAALVLVASVLWFVALVAQEIRWADDDADTRPLLGDTAPLPELGEVA